MTRKKEPEVVDLDTGYAMAQAAAALDETMKVAAMLNDTGAMLEVVNGWLTIATLLNPEEPEEVPGEARSLIGFTNE